MRILIIEDEPSLTDVLESRLKKEKYIIDVSHDGEDGLLLALTGIYDLIILDVMLPNLDGFEILKEIRNNNVDTKVILLTAKSLLEDKLIGFENGANDYLTKPFHIEELVARVNLQLKKTDINLIKDNLEYEDLILNVKTAKLKCKTTNEEINVVCKELLILEYLIQNPNQIISKEQIYDKIWGIDNEIESNNLEAYFSFIRKKLKIIGSKVNIKAIRGLGYKLEVNNEEVKE